MKHEGKWAHRFRDNPIEEAFAREWAKANAIEGRGILDYLLAGETNRPAGEVTDRDALVAATVIQWLGSPVGQGFLQAARRRASAIQGARDKRGRRG